MLAWGLRRRYHGSHLRLAKDKLQHWWSTLPWATLPMGGAGPVCEIKEESDGSFKVRTWLKT
jgi:hypothetical protein